MEKTYLYNLKWTAAKSFAASLSIQSDELEDLPERARGVMDKLVSTNGQSEQHRCQEHGIPYQPYEKEGRVWYAHNAGNEWCREK